MRCPDCNKFVPFDTETDPETDVSVDDDGAVSGTVRIVNTCEECGQELKDTTFDVDVDLSAEFAEHKKEHPKEKHNLTLDFEPSRTDRMENKDRRGKTIKNSRYMKHMYGAEGEIILTCSCDKWEHRETWSDEVAGSGMEELV
jgi:hypothetical protein